jgi:hypothetical protein
MTTWSEQEKIKDARERDKRRIDQLNQRIKVHGRVLRSSIRFSHHIISA